MSNLVLSRLTLVFVFLAACAPRATTPVVTLERNARVVTISGALRVSSKMSLPASTVHEIVIYNSYPKAKRFTFAVAARGGLASLRLMADVPDDGKRRADLDDQSDNEQKGAVVSNPTSKVFYLYVKNRAASTVDYNLTVLAE